MNSGFSVHQPGVWGFQCREMSFLQLWCCGDLCLQQPGRFHFKERHFLMHSFPLKTVSELVAGVELFMEGFGVVY